MIILKFKGLEASLKGSKEDPYILYKKNGEEIKFEGFGTSVPEEIIEEIGIKKIRLDSDESNSINLGEQLEGPFLLSEKTSTRAGAIGRLIGVNVIDDALKETLKDTRNTSIRKKDTEDRIAKLENELKEYEYLTELENKLNKIEKLRNKTFEKLEKREALIKCNKRYNEINKDLHQINYQLNKLNKVNEISPLIENIEKNMVDFKYLNIKRTNYMNYQREIEKYTRLMNQLEGIDYINIIIIKSNNIFIKNSKLLINKTKFNTITKEKSQLINIYNKLDELPAAEKVLFSFEKKPVLISKLIKLRNDYNKNQANLITGNDFIDQFKGIEISESIYKDLENTINTLSKLLLLSKKILSLKTNLNKEINEHNRLKEEIKIQLYNYKELLKKIEICPFCLSNINNEKVEHIISHYN